MGQYKKLWYTLMAVLVVTFGILGYYGTEVYKQAPPIPEQYVCNRRRPNNHHPR